MMSGMQLAAKAELLHESNRLRMQVLTFAELQSGAGTKRSGGPGAGPSGLNADAGSCHARQAKAGY